MEHSLFATELSETTRLHPYRSLVERVAASIPFQSSPRLRSFFLYVADCALRNAPEEATEQHIGIHVFQRPAGYNSSEDSIVRTNARILRQKLAEYFGHEGIDEDIVIEIPKGHYLPVFHPRAAAHPALAPSAAVAVGEPPSPPAHSSRISRRARVQVWGVLVLLALMIFAGVVAWRAHRAPQDAMDRFWAPFLAGNDSLVIYSNALFLGDSKNGLRYAPPSTPANPAGDNYVDTYTGVGELASVYDLTRLFDSHHAQFTLKRSLLVTWDEARNQNLIFIGSVAENPSLRVLPDTMNFALTTGDGWSGIVNRHPKPGELALYSEPQRPLTRDYAILALLPGLVPGRKVLIFSGLTTMGTQAAVEFACHPDSVQQIMRYAATPDDSVHPFEAVLDTTLGGGVPLQTKLVTIHMH